MKSAWKNRHLPAIILSCLCLACAGGGLAPNNRIVYVNSSAQSAIRDGLSWETAFTDLSAALSLAVSGQAVWVARGTYQPADGRGRNSTFTLKSGVLLIGGFSGVESSIEERNLAENTTIISGDIGLEGDRSDNCYHVVIGADNTLIDGFTITGGNADSATLSEHGYPNSAGGGMLNWEAAPQIKNCLFTGNAALLGGGLYNKYYIKDKKPLTKETKKPLLADTVFVNNFASQAGGGVYNDFFTNTVFYNCRFSRNKSKLAGGGIYINNSSPEFYNCLFVNNLALNGGAIREENGSNPVFGNCTVYNNLAIDTGGGFYQGKNNHPIIYNSLIWHNTAESGPGNYYNFHQSYPYLYLCSTDKTILGDNLLMVKPEFQDVKHDNYSLKDGSSLKLKKIGYDSEYLGQEIRLAYDYQSRELVRIPYLYSETHSGETGKISVVYVSRVKKEYEDGLSWKTAFSDPQDALNLAYRVGAEVWVAAGLYIPNSRYGRYSSFFLRDRVTVYGGFMGSETRRDERDFSRNQSIFSGDIGIRNNPTDNCYHVIAGADHITLDGIMITDGYADSIMYDGQGGALILYARKDGRGYNAVIRNSIFKNNYAMEGGAVYLYNNSVHVFENCIFTANAASFGGVIVERKGTESHYINCIFEGNSSRWHGGAFFADSGAKLFISSCQFIKNLANSHGGAVFLTGRADGQVSTDFTITDSAFRRNSSALTGGAIANFQHGKLLLNGTVFNGNSSGKGGGAVATLYFGLTVISRCDFEGNSALMGSKDLETDPDSDLSIN